MAQFEVDFEGQTYPFDTAGLRLSEARELKKWLKVHPPEWYALIADDDPEAISALLCLLLRRAGQPELRFSEVDGAWGSFRIRALDVVSEDDAEDPTSADISTSATTDGIQTPNPGSSTSPEPASDLGS